MVMPFGRVRALACATRCFDNHLQVLHLQVLHSWVLPAFLLWRRTRHETDSSAKHGWFAVQALAASA